LPRLIAKMEPYLWWRALVKTRFALLIFGWPPCLGRVWVDRIGCARAPSLT
jgi:hypothetical protein